MIGRTVLHYTIEGRLGAGGMGEVYLASDTRLDRKVALKFLPESLRQDPMARDRLLREAKSASQLSHPSVVTIYGIETVNGRDFIVMEYVSGSTLAARIETGGLSVRDCLGIAIQIGEGLDRAHRAGIVHRDLKPANILLDKEGQVKILDFGLALRHGAAKLTQEGQTPGTAAYMSPEQVRNETVDRRTDLWSLGIVLYEMLTGRPPFSAEHPAALMYSIVHEEFTPPADLRPDTPASLAQAVQKALAKSRDQRYQTADEMVMELRTVLASIPGETGRAFPSAAPPSMPSLAVLPFVNMSDDPNNEYFSDGLTEDLITALSKFEGLRVVSRTSAFRFKGKDLDIPRIGEQLHVDTVLEGSVRTAGKRVRITAQLIKTTEDSHIWAEKYDRSMEDIFQVQDEIVGEIVDALRVKLRGRTSGPLVNPTTTDQAAYHLYLEGRFHWNKRTREGSAKAISFLQHAIARDPGYALAHAALADVHTQQGVFGLRPPAEVFPAARASALEALRLDDNLAEAHASLAHVRYLYDWQWSESEKGFKRAIELNPGYSLAYLWYALLLLCTGQLKRAMTQIQEAHRRDPLSLIINTDIGLIHYYARRFEEALDQYQRTLEIEEGFFVAHYGIALAEQKLGHHDRAIHAAERSLALSQNSNLVKAMVARSHALAGNRDRATAILAELIEESRRSHVSPYSLALVYAGLREYDQAFEQLELALANKSLYAMHFTATGDPAIDDLRADLRFAPLMRRMGLES